ncbi:MAG: thioredoxin family protein [Bdellovibrionales bacterium]
MALMYTPPGELNSKLPEFSTLSVSGKTIKNSDFAGAQGLLVMFICNHCPYVKAIEDRLIQLGQEFKESAVKIVAVCSNDASDYPEDSFENIKKTWEQKNYPFEYLYDESQSMAKNFGAVCTPDFFLYKNDAEGMKLFYRGRLDDSWKDASTVKNRELSAAIQALLAGEPMVADQKPSMGCSIKWK